MKSGPMLQKSLKKEETKKKREELFSTWISTKYSTSTQYLFLSSNRIYKMPDGKPENVFGFDGAYKDPEFAVKVFP